MTKVINKPPQPVIYTSLGKSIFLAGSIEMGKAEMWQNTVVEKLTGYDMIYNPRRDDWDSSWKQTLENPNFVYQVTWELDALDLANVLFIYFQPGTKSPISLLEFGLFLGKKPIVLVCPEGFWRKGNVDILAGRYNIPCLPSLDDGIGYAEELIKK